MTDSPGPWTPAEIAHFTSFWASRGGPAGGPQGRGAGFLQATSSALSHHRLGRVCFGGRRDSEALLRREPVSCRRQLERVTAFTFSVWKCLWMKCLGHRCHSSEHEGDAKWVVLVLSQLTRLLNKLSSVYLGECELWLYGEKDCDMASCNWNSESKEQH